jgi:hypothetical protein
MPNFVHSLDRIIYPLQPFIILIALIVWGFAAIDQISAIRSRMPGSPQWVSRKFIASALVFVGIIGGEFAVATIIKLAALNEIRPKLSADVEAVSLDNVPFERTDGLVTALRNMHDTMGHHSHPTTRDRLLVKTSRGPLGLELRRDSQDVHEYWVFYPEFNSTKMNDVGHVFTDALDGVSPRWELAP